LIKRKTVYIGNKTTLWSVNY